MRSTVMNQASGILKEKRKKKVWLAVIVSLALVVALGTTAVLTLPGIAMTHKNRVLDCPYADGELVLAHTHNSDCYDANGNLVCTLPELEAHTHSAACYSMAPVLVCGLEETSGHTHSDACYTEERTLVCGQEESEGHVHTEECYELVRGELTCSDESADHVHDDSCYDWYYELVCGLEESEGHTHSDDCYAVTRTLTCGQVEAPAHIHTDACYELRETLTCGKVETSGSHEHTAACFRTVEATDESAAANQSGDPTADVETSEDWTALAQNAGLTGKWAQDVVNLAKSQIGYTESNRNYETDAQGVRHGYTRYNDWNGTRYSDWNAAFAAFTYHYANIPESAMPLGTSVTGWMQKLIEAGQYADAGSYSSKPGDLLFADSDGDGIADLVAIVTDIDKRIQTVAGDIDGAVRVMAFAEQDVSVLGYGILPEQNAAAQQGETTVVFMTSPDYPVQNFEATAGGVTVSVYAPEGAFPAGTTMEVTPVYDEEALSAIADSVDGTGSTVLAVDITFFDADGKQIEPEIPIQVVLTSGAISDAEEPVLVHVDGDGETSVVDGSVEDSSVIFESDEFSVYAIVDKENNEHQIRVKYVFENEDGTPYEFQNSNGEFVSYQIIKNGESLDNVGIPPLNADGETFNGWYIYANGSLTGEKIVFDSPITIEGGADATVLTSSRVAIADADNQSGENGENPDYVVTVRASTGPVHYITFWNEVDGQIIFTKVQIPEGATYDISQHKAVPPDAIIDPDTQEVLYVTYAFTGWSSQPGTLEANGRPDTRTEITNTTITVNEDLEFYPIFRLSHWISFFSAPTGTGATYYPAVYVRNGQTAVNARPATNPVWEGHTFVGWFTTPDGDTENADDPAYVSLNESANGAFNFNQQLDSDFTLYAHWNAGNANYTIIYWRQLVTDDKNATDGTMPNRSDYATEEAYQEALAAYNANSSYKHYEYAGQENKTARVTSTVTPGANATAPVGYQINNAKSTVQATVAADGSTVLNVYLDRKLITMTFNQDVTVYNEATGTTGTQYGLVNGQYVPLTYSNGEWSYVSDEMGYVPATDNSGTQYGLVDGEYKQLTRSGNNNNYTWTYPTGETTIGYQAVPNNNNDGTQYGLVGGKYVELSRFRDDESSWNYDEYWHYVAGTANNGNSSLVPANGTTYYQREYHDGWFNDYYYESQLYYRNGVWRTGNGNGSPAFTGDIYVRYNGNRYVQTTTDVTAEYTGERYKYENLVEPYTGTRYTRTTTRQFTGLYGQTLEQNGYKWPGDRGWQYQGTSRTFNMSYLGEFVLPVNRITGANNTVTTINFTSTTASRTIYYYVQNPDGTWPTEYIDAGITAAGTIQIAEKFAGFTMDGYQYNNNGRGGNYGTWTPVSPNESEKTVQDGMAIRYRRLEYVVKFLDSRNNTELSELESQTLRYGESLSDARPASNITLTPPSSEFEWDGKFYADQACTTEIDWNQTMPSHDIAVYVKWNQLWYWIKIEPDGGLLTSTEATWFWETNGQFIEEYHDVTRQFMEDENGAYYYHYDEYNPATDANQYGTNNRAAEYRLIADYEGDWTEDSYDGLRYTPDRRAYSLVGWYEVDQRTGLIQEQPFNFSSPVTHNTILRAVWRTLGEYKVWYSDLAVDLDGNPVSYAADDELGRTGRVTAAEGSTPIDPSSYADKSNSAMGAALTEVPSGYTFLGWYYAGRVYNPGDAYMLQAELAVEREITANGVTKTEKGIWMYPVLLATENLPVQATQITFHPNWTGSQQDDRVIDGLGLNVVVPLTDPEYTYTYMDENGDEQSRTIDCATADYFTRPGYRFIGWAKEPTATTPWLVYDEDNDVFTLGEENVVGVAADNESVVRDDEGNVTAYGNDLYAVWEVEYYSITVTKVVESDFADDQREVFTFVPSGFPASLGTELQRNFALAGTEYEVVTETEGGESVTTMIHNTITFDTEVPYGTTFRITEAVGSEYDVAVTVNGEASSNGAEITVTNDTTLVFTNTRRTTEITIVKIDADDDRELTGALFTLARYNGATYETVEADLEAGTVTGLRPGSYSLTETKAPDGYVIMDLPIYFELELDEDGAVITPTFLTETDEQSGEDVIVSGTNAYVDEDDSSILYVTNTAGAALPMTGGEGVRNLMYLGGTICALAVVLLGRQAFRKKREEN